MNRVAVLALIALAAGAAFILTREDEPPAAPSGEDNNHSGDELSITERAVEMVKKVFQLPESAAPYAAAITAAEVAQGLPAGLLGRLLYQESRFRTDIITGKTRSPVGALGIAQFMPATAQDLGINPLDPWQAIPAAAAYLRRLYNSTGSWSAALAAYNWGIGNVKRKGLDNAPLETRNYVAQITNDVGVA